ncbi:MAG: ATP-binding protein [Acidimicrobiia bacterium]|nr:ATP-binding protein [Acidimicrobiia bacterium]
MTRPTNPFRPGFNQEPPLLAGRAAVLGAVDDALETADVGGVTPRPLVLVGPRGVGKTVLLVEIAHAAARWGWPTATVEVVEDGALVSRLVGRLTQIRGAVHETPRGRALALDSITAKAGIPGVADFSVAASRRERPEPPAEAEFALENSLLAAMEALAARQAGLVVTVDEAHNASRVEMGGFTSVLQQHVPQNLPLLVAFAGLPSMREEHRKVTYLERAEWHEIGFLDRASTQRALAEPARNAGRPMDDAAVEILADATGGYPYAIQVFGRWAWRVSLQQPSITEGHALEAVAKANEELGAGLYSARWGETEPLGRRYLHALAELLAEQRTASGAEIAARLDRKPGQLSYLRDRLLRQGTLYAQGRQLRFAVPGMADWILDRHPEDL